MCMSTSLLAVTTVQLYQHKVKESFFSSSVCVTDDGECGQRGGCTCLVDQTDPSITNIRAALYSK